jgi:hypothetical protein
LGWVLLATGLLGAAAGVLLVGWPDQVEGWLGGRPTYWWLAGVLGVVVVVGLIAGLRLILAGGAPPGRAWADDAPKTTTLVPIEPTEAAAPTASHAGERVAPEPTYWPPEQAIGQGWARASDLAQRNCDVNPTRFPPTSP